MLGVGLSAPKSLWLACLPQAKGWLFLQQPGRSLAAEADPPARVKPHFNTICSQQYLFQERLVARTCVVGRAGHTASSCGLVAVMAVTASGDLISMVLQKLPQRPAINWKAVGGGPGGGGGGLVVSMATRRR